MISCMPREPNRTGIEQGIVAAEMLDIAWFWGHIGIDLGTSAALSE
jgi:hypothetical protein